MNGDTDELTIRRARKLLDECDLYVREVRMWDGNTWHIVVVGTESEEETTLQSVTTKDALPFLQSLIDYAKLVVDSGMHD